MTTKSLFERKRQIVAAGESWDEGDVGALARFPPIKLVSIYAQKTCNRVQRGNRVCDDAFKNQDKKTFASKQGEVSVEMFAIKAKPDRFFFLGHELLE